MSSRMTGVQFMLEDQLTLACILKELQKMKINLMSPEFILNENLVGWIPFRVLAGLPPGGIPAQDQLTVSAFYDGDSWFAVMPEGDEVGPFTTKKEAVEVIHHYGKAKNWTFLSEIPW